MSAFTPEQQAEIDAAVARMKTELDAEYSKRAHRFRAWIIANPLPAARWIGSVVLFVGIAIGWKASPLLSRLFG
jgi:hypothetical protein